MGLVLSQGFCVVAEFQAVKLLRADFKLGHQ